MIRTIAVAFAILTALTGLVQVANIFAKGRRSQSSTVRTIMKHLGEKGHDRRSQRATTSATSIKELRAFQLRRDTLTQPWLMIDTYSHLRATALVYCLLLLTLQSFIKALLPTALISLTLIIGELTLRYNSFITMKTRIRYDQREFFDQLSQTLDEGRSFDVAFVTATKQVGGLWQEVFTNALKEISNGLDLRTAVLPTVIVFELSRLKLLIEMTKDTRLTSEIPQIVRSISMSIKDEIHREHLTTIEKRTQLVWIPVSIAVLIPGSLLLLIPLFNSLKLLANL